MTVWKLIDSSQQEDELGNIYQIQGGVIPKACQNCKKPFNAEVHEEPITQNIPFYECIDCIYKTGDPTEAFDHKLETEHDIKRVPRSRVVTVIKTLVGTKANIRKVYIDDEVTDVEILCDKCV